MAASSSSPVRPSPSSTTVDDCATSTFSELDARSTRLVSALKSAGVQWEDRVAILDRNSTETVEFLFRAAKAVTVLNWRCTPAELGGIMDHTRPRLVIVHTDFVGALCDQLARLDAKVPST